MRDLVSCVAPDETIDESTRFVLRRPSSEAQFSLKLLFDGKRRIVTPLLWLAFFAETLTYITLSSLLTLLLQQAGLSLGLQLQTYAFASVGAAASIVLVALLIDRFGFVACVASALVAATATLGIGLTGVKPIVIMIMAVLAMSFGSATHNSLLGIVGGFYPTVVRANAVGYAASMGRIAGIVGPAMTSVLLADNSLQFVLMFIAVPDLIVAMICIVLAY